MTSFVAILPDGTEYFEECSRGSKPRQDVAFRACRIAGMTTPRSNPQVAEVMTYVLEIKDGKLERIRPELQYITPDLSRMTAVEYEKEIGELLMDIPNEFARFIRFTAYETGHSSGYEEVVNEARGLAVDLEPVIKEYTKRILSEYKEM